MRGQRPAGPGGQRDVPLDAALRQRETRPAADELDPGPLNRALDAALADCETARVTGAAGTPFVLGRIEQQTAVASIPANLALAENNARVAAAVAGALTGS